MAPGAGAGPAGETIAVWSERAARWLARAPSASRAASRVADSWLLRDGAVRGWELHRERFTESCLAAGAGRATLDELWAALPAALPRRGDWFPRLEMGEGGGFLLRVRPCPPRPRRANVWLTDRDPRAAPRVKGPDIDSLMRLRAEAQARGAQEAVLVNSRGEPIEGAGSSIAWWKGGALCLVPAGEPILDGVTRRLLREIAARLGIEAREEPLPAAEVGRHETWLLSALSGIVPVVGWLGRGEAAPIDRARLMEWRGRLEGLARPLAPGPPRPTEAGPPGPPPLAG